ncbi:MAG: lipoyl(octanoyl) transferase LipB [Acinetobacter populi]|jgi:lipoyl(octanoyl) transferase|uniref:lipoyl(octanoyl) transferase LipB n=1 Tax=Acinetobacter populi TaxID=1582270 RepID=UPI0023558C4F|nr:lipoyl(octanoyl) transferase LipB [Acinetobacter populi]MCH4246796.1 lipoyl(octanoyl) transferase LipB [Acinetobacter populi]
MSNVAPLIQPQLIIHTFEQLQDYTEKFEAMKEFTFNRDEHSIDQLWLLQHPSTLTQGQAGKAEHILIPTNIPVVHTDRGGQVTWHGPGQLVAYFLFDLNRLKWHVRDLVDFAENMMLWILQQYGIHAYTKKDAPGVYVDQRKIGSLGFKIRRGRSYHGLALNIDCALDGFHTINPCGYAGLEMVRLCDLVQPTPSFLQVCDLAQKFIEQQNIFAKIDTQVH